MVSPIAKPALASLMMSYGIPPNVANTVANVGVDAVKAISGEVDKAVNPSAPVAPIAPAGNGSDVGASLPPNYRARGGNSQKTSVGTFKVKLL